MRLVPVEIGLLVRVVSVETDLLWRLSLLRLTTFWRWLLDSSQEGKREHDMRPLGGGGPR